MIDLPRVTYLLATYKNERFVEEALESALAQDYPALDIVVTDDCSDDATWTLISRRLARYDGPHRVKAVRQSENLYQRHMRAVWPLVTGEYCVFACGDDVSMPDRTRRVIDCHVSTGATVVTSNAALIDEAGLPLRTHRTASDPVDLSLEHFAQHGSSIACFGAGMSWHRVIFDYFGPLRPGPRNCDRVIPFRGMLLGGIGYLPDELVRWRQREGNLTLSKQVREAETDFERLLLNERRLSNDIANTDAILHDLKFFTDHEGRSGPLDAARRSMLMRLMDLVHTWSLLRYDMAQQRIGIA